VRSEDDLRAALRALERYAPDLEAVLSAVARSGVARRRARHRRWLRVGGPILAALAVTAAILVPLAVRGVLATNKPTGPSSPLPANPSAQQVLEAAARVAAAQPAQAGKYWRVSIASSKLIAAGPNAHPYALQETLSPWVTWYPANPDKPGVGTVAYSDSGYTTKLASAGAEAQWKADGSPALPSGKLPVVRTEPFNTLTYFAPARTTLPSGSVLQWTPAQYQSLPSDPAALKAHIIAMTKDSYQSGVTDQQSYHIFGAITDLLDHEPITPQVRAAAFQVLAGLPGVEMLGQVTDAVGRPGYAIGLGEFAAKTYGWTSLVGSGLALVISPTAGTLLAEESIASAQDVTNNNQEVTRSTRAVKHPATSGAVSGPASCSSEFAAGVREVRPTHPYTYGGLTYCVPANATVKVLPEGDGTSDQVAWAVPHQAGVEWTAPLGPQVELSVGMVTGAYTILSEGWTNDTPSASASAQGIPGQ